MSGLLVRREPPEGLASPLYQRGTAGLVAPRRLPKCSLTELPINEALQDIGSKHHQAIEFRLNLVLDGYLTGRFNARTLVRQRRVNEPRWPERGRKQATLARLMRLTSLHSLTPTAVAKQRGNPQARTHHGHRKSAHPQPPPPMPPTPYPRWDLEKELKIPATNTAQIPNPPAFLLVSISKINFFAQISFWAAFAGS